MKTSRSEVAARVSAFRAHSRGGIPLALKTLRSFFFSSFYVSLSNAFSHSLFLVSPVSHTCARAHTHTHIHFLSLFFFLASTFSLSLALFGPTEVISLSKMLLLTRRDVSHSAECVTSLTEYTMCCRTVALLSFIEFSLIDFRVVPSLKIKPG